MKHSINLYKGYKNHSTNRDFDVSVSFVLILCFCLFRGGGSSNNKTCFRYFWKKVCFRKIFKFHCLEIFFLLTSWARFSDFQGQVTPATKKTIFLHQHQLQPQSRNSLESRRKEEEAGLQKLVRQRPKMLKNCCLCRIMFYLEPSDCNYRWAQKFFLRTLRSKISLLVTNLWKIESNLK